MNFEDDDYDSARSVLGFDGDHNARGTSENIFFSSPRGRRQGNQESLVVSDDDGEETMPTISIRNKSACGHLDASPIPSCSICRIVGTKHGHGHHFSPKHNGPVFADDGQTEILNQILLPGQSAALLMVAPEGSPARGVGNFTFAKNNEKMESTRASQVAIWPQKLYQKPRTTNHPATIRESSGNIIIMPHHHENESSRQESSKHVQPVEESRKESSATKKRTAASHLELGTCDSRAHKTSSSPQNQVVVCVEPSYLTDAPQAATPYTTTTPLLPPALPHMHTIMNSSSSMYYQQVQHHQEASAMMSAATSDPTITSEAAAMIDQPPIIALRPRSRAIAIQRPRKAINSKGYGWGGPAPSSYSDEESNEHMYDSATWRMYHRIVDHRKSQRLLQDRHQRSSGKNDRGDGAAMTQEGMLKTASHRSVMMLMPFPVDHSSSGSSSCSDDDIFDMEL
jgi:hypothetical protein